MIRSSKSRSAEPDRCNLAGKGVLVTRPSGQAEGLCRLISSAGGCPVPFPVIAIRPAEDPRPAQLLLGQSWDLIVFVSRNAVEHSLSLLPQGRLPSGPQVAAVGQATALALCAAGRAADLVPTGRFDSESLLSLPELAVMSDKRVLIVRGQGGRPLLGDTLVERGARLAYAEVYRRVIPDSDPAPLLARWEQDVQLATATSGEVLKNLLTLVGRGGRTLLLATPLVVVSERTARTARCAGFARVELAKRAADEAVVAALCRAIEPSHPA